MKTISVTVDDETHRLAKIRAAESGTTVSAMMRELLTALLQSPPDDVEVETEPERRRRMLRQVMDEFERKGIGLKASERLTREEIYDRHASR